ncbi:hypothetical protein KP509_03G096000 [Ceratopteris richardii]|uniref:Homeobox domain-containing protein n=1 Tax=Ceratopteris richardii TaxID=49495 RepID=A0A8T2VDT9_CERRI|nr:hypothetical protein KP509_03G096000 [Ceratopteris richardii]
MKEAIGADATGGAAEELMRSISTGPHKRFASSGAQDYDNIAGTVRNGVGEDQMSMDFMEHIDSGDYMDHLEGGGVGGELVKKGSRRLGYDQVKALEKAFELENRLEPERKTRLAAQLGLQPRQVAVWFQNRRARWKTKQMERDYALLKNKFEALKADRNKLLQEKDHLQAEVSSSPPLVSPLSSHSRHVYSLYRYRDAHMHLQKKSHHLRNTVNQERIRNLGLL